MKKIFVIITFAVISIFSLLIARDQIIKTAITITATKVIGAPVHIDRFSLSLLNKSVRISGLRIYNPKGFSKAILVDLPKINILYDLGALLKKKLHLINAEIELKEMGLEKNKQGNLNVDELAIVKQKDKQNDKTKNSSSGQIPMQIDMLRLSMGRVIYKDYSVGGNPVVNVYDINLRRDYKNITSAQQLTALVLTETMKAAGIKGASIYGAVVLSGAAFFPVAIASTFTGKDSVQQEFTASFDRIYVVSLAVLKQRGKVSKEDKTNGVISAVVNGTQVNLKINKPAGNKVQVNVSARKYLFPKIEVAGGIIYDIDEKLK